MRKLNKCSRSCEADRGQRQVVAAKVRSSQRQRPADVAVNHSHVVHVITGIGNASMGGSDGRLTAKSL